MTGFTNSGKYLAIKKRKKKGCILLGMLKLISFDLLTLTLITNDLVGGL